MPGIEYYWRNKTNNFNTNEINPIGDMDINGYQDVELINDMLRRYKNKISKTEPAVTTNY